MKNFKSVGSKGFSLIELLMAILIISILAVVGITQFSNFSADAKNSATYANLSILRNAIGVMNGLERIRCKKVGSSFPNVTSLIANDITAPAVLPAVAPCDPAFLVDPATGVPYSPGTMAAFAKLIPMNDRPFVQVKIPDNPWNGSSATVTANFILDDKLAADGVHCLNAPTATVNAAVCQSAVNPPAVPLTSTNGGWCYCEGTGQIWTNTANNGLGTSTGNESTF